MKKIFFAFVAGFIPALATTNQTYAQVTNVIASAQQVNQFPTDNNTAALEKAIILNGRQVNIKAVRNFLKFYHVKNEKWCEAKNGLTASYTSDGIFTNVYYDKKGNWKDCLKGYTEDKMDPELRDLVKQEYYDYQINYVQEVITAYSFPQPTYFVHIENDKNFKTIQINNGEMTVYEECNRTGSNPQ